VKKIGKNPKFTKIKHKTKNGSWWGTETRKTTRKAKICFAKVV